jgi:hypothetical protein
MDFERRASFGGGGHRFRNLRCAVPAILCRAAHNPASFATRLQNTTCLWSRRRGQNTNVFGERRFPVFTLKTRQSSHALPHAALPLRVVFGPGMPVIVITEQPEILVQNNRMEHGSYAIQMGRQFRLYVSRSP